MKNKILESAIRQIKKYGIRRFTMDDIAQDLRISKKTLYQHFSSKNQLLGVFFQRQLSLKKNDR
jgi:AcrR family transcriptional regulator